jgi:hypothetical protein
MMTLQLESKNATVVSINPRGEHHGDEKALGVDIDLRLETDGAVLGQFALGPAPEWRSILWDDTGEVRNIGLKPLRFDRRFEDHTVEIGVARRVRKFKDSATITKIVARPAFGFSVELSLQIQIHPALAEMEFISEGIIAEKVRLKIEEPSQVDFFETPAAETEGAAQPEAE